MRRPTQDDRCSFELRTVGWTQDQSGSATRVPPGPVAAVHRLGDLTLATWVIWAGA